jgi:hypothetical protein
VVDRGHRDGGQGHRQPRRPGKIKAEYWADGPHSEFPPGHWAIFAQAISRKRGHSLDDDVKLFLTLGNALMDASIAAWAWKFKYDYARPITGIRELYFGASVTVPAGTSRIEPRTAEHPGTPAKDVTLYWPTFSAADEAGMSRRYGGIHFESGDLHGRSLGAAVGGDAWVKAQSYIRPFNTGPI